MLFISNLSCFHVGKVYPSEVISTKSDDVLNPYDAVTHQIAILEHSLVCISGWLDIGLTILHILCTMDGYSFDKLMN